MVDCYVTNLKAWRSGLPPSRKVKTMIETETWMDVCGYAGLYWVSDLGRFKILHTRSRGGRIQYEGTFEGDITCFLIKGTETRKVFLGNLVLETFVGPRPEGLNSIGRPTIGCCHYDDNRANNRLDNLRWGNASDNKKDAIRNGIANIPKGERHAKAKMTASAVIEA